MNSLAKLQESHASHAIQFFVTLDQESYTLMKVVCFISYRLYRDYQRQLEEELRERLHQKEQFARERAAKPKPWRPKQPRKRKANYCGRYKNLWWQSPD